MVNTTLVRIAETSVETFGVPGGGAPQKSRLASALRIRFDDIRGREDLILKAIHEQGETGNQHGHEYDEDTFHAHE